MSDTDSDVKTAGFGTLFLAPATHFDVAGKDDEKGEREDFVTAFTRMKIRDWHVTQGRQIQELARIAGIAKSSPSQVIAGSNGVGKKTIIGYARAFGFSSADAYRAAALEWWRSQGGAAAAVTAVPHTDAMQAAINAVVALGQGTIEQLETILLAYSHPRFRDRDSAWWTQTLLSELAKDREALQQDRADRALINETQRTARAAQKVARDKENQPTQTEQARRRRAL